ncbi:unnamed protein product [Lampetra fluviatilis]
MAAKRLSAFLRDTCAPEMERWNQHVRRRRMDCHSSGSERLFSNSHGERGVRGGWQPSRAAFVSPASGHVAARFLQPAEKRRGRDLDLRGSGARRGRGQQRGRGSQKPAEAVGLPLLLLPAAAAPFTPL